MGFNKKINLGITKITINISCQPFFESKNVIVFGYPINFNKSLINFSNLEFGNTVKGHWLKIDLSEDAVNVTTDILGGFRVYYCQIDNEIIISDDYKCILSHYNKKPVLNVIEYDFWLKHGFTTGQSTFVDNLLKVSPACTLILKDNLAVEESYFLNKERTPDITLHKNLIHQDLLNTFKNIKDSNKKVILFFSGGKDSCLLLQYLISLKIPFTPVFLKLNPISRFGADDIEKVRAISKELNIDLDEIEIKLSQVTKQEKEDIVSNQIFDKHYSLLHYLGYREIRKKYSEKCLIINGQSSDSILSFGPSENSLMSYFRREIMYKPNTLVSKLGLLLLIFKTKRVFKLPKLDLERLTALFDEYKYTRVIDKTRSKAYLFYLDKYILKKTKHLTSFSSKEMYVKILSFSQGSDNQVVVNSSKKYNIDTIMPFATPEIIYSTIKYKNESLEIKKPKYVIDNILKDEFSFFYDELDLNNVDTKDLIINQNNEYSDEMESLFLKNSKKIIN